jgi:hypothetical protein
MTKTTNANANDAERETLLAALRSLAAETELAGRACPRAVWEEADDEDQTSELHDTCVAQAAANLLALLS